MSLPGVHTWSELGARLGLEVPEERARPRRRLLGRLPEGRVEVEVLEVGEVGWLDVALIGVALVSDAAAEGYDGTTGTALLSRLRLALDPPLHVALRMQARGCPKLPASPLVDPRSGKPGDLRLDGRYELSAEEPPQARAFLDALDAGTVLPAIHQSGWLASFDARRIDLVRPGGELRPEPWRVALDTAGRLATRLRAAAAQVAPAAWRAPLERWRQPCEARGLAAVTTGGPPERFAGEIGGRRVVVEPGVRDGKRSTVLRAELADAERLPVELVPQTAQALVEHGLRDLKVGDAELDRRFVVLAADVATARAGLPEELRRRLVALQGRGIGVRAEGRTVSLEVAGLLEDPDALGRGLDELVWLTGALAIPR